MKTGTVKFFNEIKGFGFIVEDGSDTDTFVHASALKGIVITKGDNVSYEEEEGKRGINAVNVTKIK